jgi:LuxR family transcriptional regulator, activator of conjugal transfer of Ti plasmids
MYRVYQTFIDRLAESANATALREGMAEAIRALDLSCFAYLCVSNQQGVAPQLISTYPSTWTTHYLKNNYERFDPVIVRALQDAEPFEWGLNSRTIVRSSAQQELFEEAAKFGIGCGFTVPIHDGRGQIAAVTFAADERRTAAFSRRVEEHREVLQLMAMYFHAHARRKLAPERMVDGVALSPREFECLVWAAQGKSAWEIGCILGISRRTAAFHLDNAKAKLGVHSICQAVARLIASRPTMNNPRT